MVLRSTAYLVLKIQIGVSEMTQTKPTFCTFVLLSIFACAFSLTPLQAATLTNTTTSAVSTLPTPNVDLSAIGTLNWAAWDTDSGSTTSIAPTQVKAAGVGTVSSITESGTASSTVRGSTNRTSSVDTFTWTTSDESSNTAAPVDGILIGAFNTNLDHSDAGVQFNITDLAALTGGQYYEINIFTSAFRAQGILNASIVGDPGSLISQNGIYHGASKYTEYHTIAYNPDSISDSLNIAYDVLVEGTSGGETSSHISIQAVAYSIVPEPSTFALLLIFGLGSLGLRRRKA